MVIILCEYCCLSHHVLGAAFHRNVQLEFSGRPGLRTWNGAESFLKRSIQCRWMLCCRSALWRRPLRQWNTDPWDPDRRGAQTWTPRKSPISHCRSLSDGTLRLCCCAQYFRQPVDLAHRKVPGVHKSVLIDGTSIDSGIVAASAYSESSMDAIQESVTSAKIPQNLLDKNLQHGKYSRNVSIQRFGLTQMLMRVLISNVACRLRTRGKPRSLPALPITTLKISSVKASTYNS